MSCGGTGDPSGLLVRAKLAEHWGDFKCVLFPKKKSEKE